jgi:menaquinone-dependent protoporphyrinogen IX oxidase
MKGLVFYDSMGGNTRKMAESIHDVAVARGLACDLVRLEEGVQLDFLDYEALFLGSPAIEWLPTAAMMTFLKSKLKDYRLQGEIPSAAIVQRPGRFSVCFSTNCGAHIGIDEALPATQWMAAFLGHIGYRVLDQIHVPGQMRNFGQGADWMTEQTFDDLNTLGVYGDIRGRPSAADLAELQGRVHGILDSVLV